MSSRVTQAQAMEALGRVDGDEDAYDTLTRFISTHPDTYTDGAHTAPESAVCDDGFTLDVLPHEDALIRDHMAEMRGDSTRYCHTCGGSGRVERFGLEPNNYGIENCPHCHGTGHKEA